MEPRPAPDPKSQSTRVTEAEILAVGRKLPATAHTFVRINQLLDDPNTQLDQITELVSLDPVLTFRVLRLANSAYYGFRSPSADIGEAVTRLGFREVHRLIGAIALQVLAVDRLPVYGIDSETFWRDSICSALASEWFAMHNEADNDPRAAYSAGLLRSIGKVALQQAVNLHPGLARSYLECGDGGPLLDWEHRTFGISNSEAARLLMEAWKMPASLTSAVAGHNEPDDANALTALCYLGAAVAAEIGQAMPGEAGYWARPERALQILGLEPDLPDVCAREVGLQFERMRSAFAL